MGITLVTGATGFLGSHIVDRLVQRGENVRAFVRSTSDTTYLEGLGVDIAVGDVTDELSIASATGGVTTVYHAAAAVTDWAPWKEFASVTVRGTENVLRAAARVDAKMLHVSTDAVYAISALRDVVTEESPLERRFGPFDYYRRSKSAAERIVRRAIDEDQIEASIVRPGLLLGERDRAIFPGMVVFLKSSSSAYLGNGHNRLPYVYVGDVAEACVLAATNPAATGAIYNIASDEIVTQRDLLETIAAAAGLSAPKRSMPILAMNSLAFAMQIGSVVSGRRMRPAITRYGVALLALDYREDTSKARGELGWESTITLSESIDRTMEWRKNHRPVPVSS